jgi:hypothetical protein
MLAQLGTQGTMVIGAAEVAYFPVKLQSLLPESLPS